MRQYFTYVNPFFDGKWHPIEYNVEKALGSLWAHIETNFCVSQGASIGDARLLGYIEIPEDETGMADVPSYPTGKYPAASVMDMILQIFPNVRESVEEAKDKVERWTGRNDIIIDGDKIIIPENDKDITNV